MLSGIQMDKRQLLALCLCNIILSLQATITISLLPVYAIQLGAEPATTGLMVSFAFLGVTLGNITGGWLSDRLGRRKPLLLTGCAVWIPIILLMPLSTDIRWLMLTTAVSWFPGGLALSNVNIITALATVEGERGKVFGWMALASGIGALVAGAVAGPIAVAWGFPVLFWVMAAINCLLLAIAFYIHDKPTERVFTPTHAHGGAPSAKREGVGLALKLLLVAHLAVRLAQSIGGLGRPLAMTALGFDAADVSSAIAVSSAVALPLPLILGWLSDKAGRKGFLLFCYAAGSLGLFMLIPASLLWQFWLSASLLTISASDNGVAQAFAADLTPPQAMGRGMSLLSTASMIAGIIGSGAAGYLMQIFGIGPTLLFGACLPLLSIALVLRIRKPVLVPTVLSVAQAGETIEL